MMSSVDRASQPAAGGSARLGADLRAARLRIGWDLDQVAAGLRIRLGYLESLEAGRLQDLPGRAYAMGFLRTYAEALGLDADEITRRFRAECAEMNRKTRLDFPVPAAERGVPVGAVVLLGAVLAACSYAGWYQVSGRVAQAVPAIPDRLAPLAQGVADRPPPSPQVASVLPPPSPDDPAPPKLVPGLVPGLAPSLPPSQAAAAVMPPMPSASPPLAAAPDEGRIVLHATADSWMQVRDRGANSVLLNRVLHGGETWAVPAKTQLVLTTGNAGGTELIVDGVTAPSLGGPGTVRRDLPLDAELIRKGLPAPATHSLPQ